MRDVVSMFKQPSSTHVELIGDFLDFAGQVGVGQLRAAGSHIVVVKRNDRLQACAAAFLVPLIAPTVLADTHVSCQIDWAIGAIPNANFWGLFGVCLVPV